MTQQELNTSASAINKIIASNNPSVASIVLKQYYPTVVNPVSDQIEKALNILYAGNPKGWGSSIKQIPVNTNNISSQDQDSIRNIATQLGLVSPNSKLDFGQIWNSITGTLGGMTTTNPLVITTTTGSAISTTALVIISVIALILIISILYFGGVFKKA